METATREYIEAVPKVELHVHLEGAIGPGTILELAKRNSLDLPVKTVEEARDWFVFRDFYHFNKVYNAISKCLRTGDDYELIVTELGAELARQNVNYAEVTCSPAAYRWLGEILLHLIDLLSAQSTSARSWTDCLEGGAE